MTPGLSYATVSWILWCVLGWMSVMAEDCPLGCQCDRGLGTVDCSHVVIQPLTTVHHVSGTLTNTTRELYLHHSHISQLDPEMLMSLHMLQRLDLSYNEITALPQDLFHNTTTLHYLDLSYNNITVLPQYIFHNTTSLRHLDLSHNDITALTPTVFSSLTQLVHLDISYNPLKTLPLSVFANLSSLEYMNVTHTDLSTLHGSYFSSCPALVSVDLAYNHIAKISSSVVQTLRKLEKLRTFNVSQNPLKCDCDLVTFRDWVTESDVHTAAMCAGKQLQDIPPGKFLCRASSVNRPFLKNKPTMGPLVYNPQLGWYTGGVLLSMLFIFLVCVVLDRCKRHLVKLYKHKKRQRLKLKYKEERARGEAEYDADLESVASYHITPAAVAAAFHEQYLSVINQQLKYNFSDDNTAQRNMIDPNSLHRDKITKQRIEELSKSVRHDIPGISMSRDENDEENPTLTVLEVHPDCPIHSVVMSGCKPRCQEV